MNQFGVEDSFARFLPGRLFRRHSMLDKWRLGPVVDIMNGSLMVLSADIFCYPGWWAKVFRTYPLNNPLHMVLIRAFLDLEMVGAPKQGQGNEVMKRGNQPVQQNDFHGESFTSLF